MLHDIIQLLADIEHKKRLYLYFVYYHTMSRSPIEQHCMALKRFTVDIGLLIHFRKPLCVIKFCFDVFVVFLFFFLKFLCMIVRVSVVHHIEPRYNNNALVTINTVRVLLNLRMESGAT